MGKVSLTDRYVQSPQRVPTAGRKDYSDALVPGLALRVTDKGHRSFVLVARYPMAPKNPTRRLIGEYGAITLEQARDTAREWIGMIRKGVDPKIQEARRKAEAQRVQVNTFAVVAEQFLERHASKLSKAAEARRIIEGEFVKRWGLRPASDILPEEVSAAIRAIVKRGAPYQAHNALAYLRRLFNWAIGTHEFGLRVSPVEQLSPRDLIGKREARERTLNESELRAVWDGTDGMGYPYGPLLRLLILTGQREREVADMTWAEVDLGKRLWTVPAARMKGGRAHEVPLCEHAMALLEALPRFGAGDHVFTTTSGRTSVNGFSKAKVRIDKLSGVAGWKIHDLRRSMRTHLSALPVEDLVRELVIAHARPGLHKVYDQHGWQDEKRHCLALWERRLMGIVVPAVGNVVALREAAR